MLEASGSSAGPDASGTGAVPDLNVISDRASVSATLTSPSGTPILTVTLRVDPARTGEPPTVVAEGDVDLDTAPLLQAVLAGTVDHHSHVCCDVRGVTFISAAGINALLAVHRRAVDNGARLEVRGASGTTRRVLQLTGLERLLGGT